MSPAWIGLGSNLDNPAAQLQTALQQIAELPATRCLRYSSLYRSAPVGPQDQPDFCNAVAQVQTELSPGDLLQALFAVEKIHHRQRDVRWGPRTLDLDLLIYAQRQMQTDELTLPHPRMHERVFVLGPLAELDPALNVPGRGPVSELLANLSGQGVALWDAP